MSYIAPQWVLGLPAPKEAGPSAHSAAICLNLKWMCLSWDTWGERSYSWWLLCLPLLPLWSLGSSPGQSWPSRPFSFWVFSCPSLCYYLILCISDVIVALFKQPLLRVGNNRPIQGTDKCNISFWGVYVIIYIVVKFIFSFFCFFTLSFTISLFTDGLKHKCSLQQSH